MDRLDLLDEIKKCKQYDIALLTTFNLDLNFFEKNILNKFKDNGLNKISLFVDNNEFIKSLNEISCCNLGKEYLITPVNIYSSFHPKLILLLGKDKAKLIIGSWNLTPSAYFRNDEIGNIFYYDSKYKENLLIIKSAMDFFIRLNEITDKRDSKLINSIKDYLYYNLESKQNNIMFLDNMDNSIINQIKNVITDVNQIDIVVPYYDSEILSLNKLKEKFPNSKINLYIQNETNTFQVKYENDFNIYIFDTFKDNIEKEKDGNEKKYLRFYHGKVIRFICADCSYILYGSSNCTNVALFKSLKDNGNIECNMLVKGSIDEFNYFFNNINVREDLKLKSEILRFDDENSSVNFLYLKNDFNILYFKYKHKIDDLIIILNNQKLEYTYKGNVLQVFIPIDLNVGNIFEISINGEKIKCYYIDIGELERYRNRKLIENKILNIDINFDINEDSNKYINDNISLFKGYWVVYDIYNKYSNKINYILKDDNVDSEIAKETEDDIDRDFVLTNEIFIKKENCKKVNQSNKNRFRSFKNYIISLKEKNDLIDISMQKDIDKSVKEKVERKPTTSEIKFKRFVIKMGKSLLDISNIINLDFTTYIECIIPIFEVINKYMVRERVIGMFEEDEVNKLQYDLILKLTDKFIYNITDEEKEMYLYLAIAVMLQSHYIDMRNNVSNSKINLKNSDLLRRIDEQFNIRDNYFQYLEISLNYINVLSEKISLEVANKYIESLFDYKSLESISFYIEEHFGNRYKINIDNFIFEMIVYSDKIVQFLNSTSYLPIIKEIYKAYSKKHEINQINIKIISTNINKTFPDPVVQIIYELDNHFRGYKIYKSMKGIERKEKIN